MLVEDKWGEPVDPQKLEDALKASGTRFVANDCVLDPGDRLWLVTGPNMGGKSTYMRQAAVIALLAVLMLGRLGFKPWQYGLAFAAPCVGGLIGSRLARRGVQVEAWLLGERAHGEVLSIAFGGKGQHQDAGGKCVHVAPNTSSVITSKSISKNGGRSSSSNKMIGSSTRNAARAPAFSAASWTARARPWAVREPCSPWPRPRSWRGRTC